MELPHVSVLVPLSPLPADSQVDHSADETSKSAPEAEVGPADPTPRFGGGLSWAFAPSLSDSEDPSGSESAGESAGDGCSQGASFGEEAGGDEDPSGSETTEESISREAIGEEEAARRLQRRWRARARRRAEAAVVLQAQWRCSLLRWRHRRLRRAVVLLQRRCRARRAECRSAWAQPDVPLAAAAVRSLGVRQLGDTCLQQAWQMARRSRSPDRLSARRRSPVPSAQRSPPGSPRPSPHPSPRRSRGSSARTYAFVRAYPASNPACTPVAGSGPASPGVASPPTAPWSGGSKRGSTATSPGTVSSISSSATSPTAPTTAGLALRELGGEAPSDTPSPTALALAARTAMLPVGEREGPRRGSSLERSPTASSSFSRLPPSTPLAPASGGRAPAVLAGPAASKLGCQQPAGAGRLGSGLGSAASVPLPRMLLDGSRSSVRAAPPGVVSSRPQHTDVGAIVNELLRGGHLSCHARGGSQSASDLDAVVSSLRAAVPGVEVRFIGRVEPAATVAAAYEAVRGALGPERLLWHGTSWESVPNIVRHGFNRAYAFGGRHGAKLGRGTYFAEEPLYALRFCGRPVPGTPRALLLAGVLPGRIARGEDGLVEPPEADAAGTRFDSTADNPVQPRVLCVFKDFQALPLYLVEVS